ncbi:hypothetical protein [Herbaspirillum sp. SJZ107]|uniref:hypothetical protein n=1 Tax=Herbaspirillum sp. SJZ107 TaxID=2572881 RepID=UPI00114D7622|nr:hypothetical protein [Herbaspirillum sp. SJZ107]
MTFAARQNATLSQTAEMGQKRSPDKRRSHELKLSQDSMRLVRRFIVVTACAMLALLLALPLVLYWKGLSDIDGRPPKPQQLASLEQQALVWRRAGGQGKRNIEPMNPYSYIVRIFSDSACLASPEERLAWSFASTYLREHRRQAGMSAWHLSGAALTIWLTRNWTTEEILSAAAASGWFAKDRPRKCSP